MRELIVAVCVAVSICFSVHCVSYAVIAADCDCTQPKQEFSPCFSSVQTCDPEDPTDCTDLDNCTYARLSGHIRDEYEMGPISKSCIPANQVEQGLDKRCYFALMECTRERVCRIETTPPYEDCELGAVCSDWNKVAEAKLDTECESVPECPE